MVDLQKNKREPPLPPVLAQKWLGETVLPPQVCTSRAKQAHKTQNIRIPTNLAPSPPKPPLLGGPGGVTGRAEGATHDSCSKGGVFKRPGSPQTTRHPRAP